MIIASLFGASIVPPAAVSATHHLVASVKVGQAAVGTVGARLGHWLGLPRSGSSVHFHPVSNSVQVLPGHWLHFQICALRGALGSWAALSFAEEERRAGSRDLRTARV